MSEDIGKDHCVIYIRVSTRDQAKNGNSLEVQETAGRYWAAKANREVAGVYNDTKSGSNKARPGLEKAIKHACRLHCPMVIYSMSRAARSVHHLIEIAERLKKKDAEFVSITEAIDTTTPAGKLMFNVLASVAQFELEVIRDRIADSMGAKLAAREFTGGIAPPIGWKFDPEEKPEARPRHIVPEPQAQRILIMIQELAAGKVTAYGIAKHLNQLNIKPIGISRRTQTMAERWKPQTITRILKRIGRLVYDPLKDLKEN